MLFAALAVFVSMCAFAQEAGSAASSAQVTFYTIGLLKSEFTGLTDFKHDPFIGNIFDGDQELALLEPGRFVTFNLQPGEHVFSGNWKSRHRPDPKAVLKLSLVANQHYYVGIFGASFHMSPSIGQASCKEASKYGGKPLESKRIGASVAGLVVNERAFPQCP
jgi:hypothetical protein